MILLPLSLSFPFFLQTQPTTSCGVVTNNKNDLEAFLPSCLLALLSILLLFVRSSRESVLKSLSLSLHQSRFRFFFVFFFQNLDDLCALLLLGVLHSLYSSSSTSILLLLLLLLNSCGGGWLATPAATLLLRTARRRRTPPPV